MKLKALIFDVDGTLADTEEAHRCAFNEAFRQLGLDWNWSKPKYADLLATTGGKERLTAFIESAGAAPDVRRRYLDLVPELHRAKTANFTRMAEAGLIPMRDGVERLMDDADRCQVRLSIASTTTLANIEALLRTNLGADALSRFAVIGAGDQVSRKKPAPDIYEWVVSGLGVSADECAAIEDSSNGLIAAKSAGIYTIVTPSYWTSTEDFSAADMVIPSLGSFQKPLMARAASLVGNSQLGIREIERHLNAIREYE